MPRMIQCDRCGKTQTEGLDIDNECVDMYYLMLNSDCCIMENTKTVCLCDHCRDDVEAFAYGLYE